MDQWQLRTPVAFIVFNRPDTTARVFDEIARARPPVLFLIGDGPRPDRSGEAERVAMVREIVARVDWPCDVRTEFADANLGCKRRLSTGIQWVFEQAPECIILEDDCLPDPSFFRFCEEMLERFRDDRRVFMVNGTNFHAGHAPDDASYHFSAQAHVWGWASWADRWLGHYDPAIRTWPTIRDEGALPDIVGGEEEARYWGPILERVYRGEIDTWDYQWAYTCMLNRGAAVTPNVNLVSNVGFGADATHTTAGEHPLANLPTQPMRFPLRHPVGMFVSSRLDRRHFREHSLTPLSRRVIGRLRRLAEVRPW